MRGFLYVVLVVFAFIGVIETENLIFDVADRLHGHCP